jgi:hypothetical protein
MRRKLTRQQIEEVVRIKLKEKLALQEGVGEPGGESPAEAAAREQERQRGLPSDYITAADRGLYGKKGQESPYALGKSVTGDWGEDLTGLDPDVDPGDPAMDVGPTRAQRQTQRMRDRRVRRGGRLAPQGDPMAMGTTGRATAATAGRGARPYSAPARGSGVFSSGDIGSEPFAKFAGEEFAKTGRSKTGPIDIGGTIAGTERPQLTRDLMRSVRSPGNRDVMPLDGARFQPSYPEGPGNRDGGILDPVYERVNRMISEEVLNILEDLTKNFPDSDSEPAENEEVEELEEGSGDRNDPDREQGHGKQRQRTSSSGKPGTHLEEAAAEDADDTDDEDQTALGFSIKEEGKSNKEWYNDQLYENLVRKWVR